MEQFERMDKEHAAGGDEDASDGGCRRQGQEYILSGVVITWSSDLSSYVNLPLDALYYDFQYKFTPSFLFSVHFLWNVCAISPPPVDWIGWSRMVETKPAQLDLLANTRQKHVLRICLNCEGVWLADKYWANVCMFCKLCIWDLAFTYSADTYLGFGKYMFGRVQVQQRSLWLGRFWWKGVISKWRFSHFSLPLDHCCYQEKWIFPSYKAK